MFTTEMWETHSSTLPQENSRRDLVLQWRQNRLALAHPLNPFRVMPTQENALLAMKTTGGHSVNDSA